MAKKTILPARTISGPAAVPGDKSISHRYAILAALAEGGSEIHNYSPADDCARTLDCLRRLGVQIDAKKDCVVITGAGLRGFKPSRRALDAGNSGTTMRLLVGALAGQPFGSTLTGDGSLRQRPMRRVIEPLSRMGAQIHARDGEFAPLKVRGGVLQPIDYTLPIPSAQVKSAVLFAALFAEGTTSVTEPIRTRDHTELALEEFGAAIERRERTIHLKGSISALHGCNLTVPGDISSALFFLAAGLLLPGSNLLLSGVGLNPTRTAVLDFLASMGAALSLVNVEMKHGELIGDIAVRHSKLEGGVISDEMVPALIDELPMLATLGPYTEKGIEIRDAGELRVKESDRIGALAENLRRMGAQVEEFPDGLRVAPSGTAAPLTGAEINPRGDHRIAMAFAIAALRAQGKSVIRDAGCVRVSFPGFFDLLDRLAER